MKKILFFVLSLSLLFTVSDFEVKASPLLNNNDDDPSLYEGLNEGEEIVDFSSVKESATVNKDILSTLSLELDDEITPYRSDVTKPVSKTYVGLSYSGWKYAGVSTISGGVLTDDIVRKRANTYTGNLTVTKGVLKAFIGFDISSSYTRASGYRTNPLPHGRYRLEYREVYQKYQVKQERRYGGRLIDTQYVYPQKWVEHQYRVVKF